MNRFPRYCDQQPAFTLQLNGQGRRRYFNPALFQLYIKRHAGLESGFTADFLRNHEPSGSINGCFHTIDATMKLTKLKALQRRTAGA